MMAAQYGIDLDTMTAHRTTCRDYPQSRRRQQIGRFMNPLQALIAARKRFYLCDIGVCPK